MRIITNEEMRREADVFAKEIIWMRVCRDDMKMVFIEINCYGAVIIPSYLNLCGNMPDQV